jgi:hypothetical protein
MSEMSSTKLGMERCVDCGHRWIDYEGNRDKCFICNGTNISVCLSLKEIRDAINDLRNDDKKYLDKQAKRSVILKQRYREIAELYLQRAQEIFLKVNEHYGKGDYSDKVIDQLIIAFRLFSELGIHKSAVSTAYMIAMGYAQRGVEKEIHATEDLNDLVAARQWFMRLGAKEWEAAVNIHIGEKALATISTDSNLLQMMMQVSIWHFYKARDYYFEHHNMKMFDRIQFDIERTAQLLASYTQGNSRIEAAKIKAHATVQHGEQVRKGLESFGRSVQYGLTALGEHIEHSGGSVSRALQSSSAALSANIRNAMYTVAATSKIHGKSLDKRMSDVGQLIATSAREVPEDYFKPVKELGAKFALSPSTELQTKEVSNDPSIVTLAESVKPELKKSTEGMKHLDEPTVKLTGTLLDTLVTKGLGKVLEQIDTAEDSKKKS